MWAGRILHLGLHEACCRNRETMNDIQVSHLAQEFDLLLKKESEPLQNQLFFVELYTTFLSTCSTYITYRLTIRETHGNLL